MKFTVLNTYDGLVQKARKIQQLARFFNRQEAANGQVKSNYTGQSSIFYILDFSHSRFLYVDPYYSNMLHLSASKPTPENFISCIHPNDLKVLNQKIIPEVLHFFGMKPLEIHGEFTISFNYRLKNGDGDYVCAMQRSNRILSSETGNSIAATGFIIDISPFKEDSKMILNIERNYEKTKPSSSDTFTSVYFPDARSHSLSNRELQILQQIGQGLCSKEIAKKLYISEFTVNNHRKKNAEKNRMQEYLGIDDKGFKGQNVTHHFLNQEDTMTQRYTEHSLCSSVSLCLCGTHSTHRFFYIFYITFFGKP